MRSLAGGILPCIWDNRDLPYDLVMTAVNRASMPQAYKERYNWERVLTLACSFVKKHRYEREKEEWKVALNKECSNQRLPVRKTSCGGGQSRVPYI